MPEGLTLRRTALATPASEQRFVHSAAASDADEVVLDLEDAVSPGEKAAARDRVVAAAREEDWSGKTLAYRMNGLDTRWWYEDVIEVVSDAGERIDDIVVPKVSSAGDLETVETLLAQVEVNAGLAVGSVGLEAQIEDGEGVQAVHEIAHATDRLDALAFGPGDYAAATGVPGLDVGRAPDYPGHYWHHVLAECNSAAKSAGIDCLDGPYAAIEDESGFREAAANANALGCDGKWVIHPDQVAWGNEVFAPDPAVAERAREIVAAYERATDAGEGAVRVDGRMVDEATRQMAAAVVARAEAAGVL